MSALPQLSRKHLLLTGVGLLIYGFGMFAVHAARHPQAATVSPAQIVPVSQPLNKHHAHKAKKETAAKMDVTAPSSEQTQTEAVEQPPTPQSQPENTSQENAPSAIKIAPPPVPRNVSAPQNQARHPVNESIIAAQRIRSAHPPPPQNESERFRHPR
jgi:uncharacterized membrane protein